MTGRRDTRLELLKTATDLIWAHAFGALSVDDICKAAHVQKGSFYHFFPSKLELARAALEYLWGEQQPELDHIFSAQKPGLNRLEHFAIAVIQEQKEQLGRLGFIVGCPFSTVGSGRCCGEDGLTELSWELLLRTRKYIVIALQDALKEKSVTFSNADGVADAISYHLIGALTAARLSRSLKPIEDLFPAWMNIIKGYEVSTL